jgi:mRNA interferase YafQ
MRRIETTTAFRRDFKREKAGRHGKVLDALLARAVELLVEDKPLPPTNRDHALVGEWKDCRDCHLRPDLLLLYRKPDADVLQLVRLGSHSELFG